MKNKQLTAVILILIFISATFMYTFTGFEFAGGQKPISTNLKKGLDIKGGVYIVYDVESTAKKEELRMLLNQTKDVLRKRIDGLGLTEPSIFIEGEKRIRIELPGASDANEALKLIGKTAQLQFAEVKNGVFVKNGDKFDKSKMTTLFYGDGVKDARASKDNLNSYSVAFKLNTDATKIFADATAKAVKYEGQIAILLDDEVISAPVVKSIINGGSGDISGSFTKKEVIDLAFLIRSGSLPVKLIEQRSSIKGPVLGVNAFKTSVFAAIIGIILVMLYMIIFYRLPGFIASLSLVLYISLTVMLMVFLNATLTLPGVLGIVLSIGMAVDANVIIYERIKEEIAGGKKSSLECAVSHGFSKALWTIIDSNVTTLIAAVVLFNFGEGSIKGFAVTLMIGILMSMFTAVFITRTLLTALSSTKMFSKVSLYTRNVGGKNEI
ncbi:MAG: protein translocase subunit SecD [Clostridiales bacterium]|nr:MAG: protein translocase subunit SecD [Clostridiales bacterium]